MNVMALRDVFACLAHAHRLVAIENEDIVIMVGEDPGAQKPGDAPADDNRTHQQLQSGSFSD
jgi:hypothetical protein